MREECREELSQHVTAVVIGHTEVAPPRRVDRLHWEGRDAPALIASRVIISCLINKSQMHSFQSNNYTFDSPFLSSKLLHS